MRTLPFSKKLQRSSSLFFTGLLLAIFSFSFSGCMKDDSNLDQLALEQEEAFKRQIGIDTVLIQQHLNANNITAKSTKTGLFYEEQTLGTGVQPVAGQIVKTHYRLFNLNGAELQSSYGKQTYDFQLWSSNGGIYGYQQGVSMLRVGGKGRFFLPSGLAYGASGQPQGNIAPNTILVFEIELIEARNP